MKPEFKPGKNIAMKVPCHEYEKTVAFYEEVLGLERKEENLIEGTNSVVFRFGDKDLWIDKVAEISQAEVWLEINTGNVEKAQKYLKEKGCTFRNEIEVLPSTIKGFWLSNPSNIIHLVVESSR